MKKFFNNLRKMLIWLLEALYLITSWPFRLFWNFLIYFSILIIILINYVNITSKKNTWIKPILIIITISILVSIFPLIYEYFDYNWILKSKNIVTGSIIVEATLSVMLIAVTTVYTIYTRRLAILQQASIIHLADQSLAPYKPRISLAKNKFQNFNNGRFLLALEFENIGNGDAINMKIKNSCYSGHGVISRKRSIRDSSKYDGTLKCGETRKVELDFRIERVEDTYNLFSHSSGLFNFCISSIYYLDRVGNAYFEEFFVTAYRAGDSLKENHLFARVDRFEAWRYNEIDYAERPFGSDFEFLQNAREISPAYYVKRLSPQYYEYRYNLINDRLKPYLVSLRLAPNNSFNIWKTPA